MTISIVEISWPCHRRVRIGVVLHGVEHGTDEAVRKSVHAYLDGDITEDNPDISILSDVTDGSAPSGPRAPAVEFEVVRDLAEGEGLPPIDRNMPPGINVAEACRAARLLLDAYKAGEENGGSIRWEHLDAAYSVALEAFGE